MTAFQTAFQLEPLALILASLTLTAGAPASAVRDTPGTIRLEFESQVQNIQSLRSPLTTDPKADLRVCRDLHGDLRYGQIPFRLPEEEVTSTGRFLAFVASYSGQALPALLLDFNQDGAIACDESVPLVLHPDDPGHAFRTVVVGGDASRPRSRYRLTLPTVLGAPGGDLFSVDLVDVPVARWRHDAGSSFWVLYDGNHNGVYDHKFGDGILIDASGRGRVSSDPYAGDFFSYNLPLRLAWGTYRILDVDPQGRYITLEPLKASDAAKSAPLAPGDSSDAMECADADGRSIRIGGATGRYQLLHFWLSQCGSCEREIQALAPVIERLGPHRLGVVGISLDVTERTYRAFIAAHRPAWPQCFVGAMFWDNPFAVRFGAVGPSDLILLDPAGRIVAQAHGLEEILPALEALPVTPPSDASSGVR